MSQLFSPNVDFLFTPAGTPSFAVSSGKDMSIWFDVGGPVGGSYARVVQTGAEQAATDMGVDLRVMYSDWQPQKMIENFKQALAAKPSGIVVMGHRRCGLPTFN